MFLGMFTLLGCLALFVVVGGIFFVIMALLRVFGWGRGYGYYRPYRRPWFFGGSGLPFLFGPGPFERRGEFFEHRHHHHEHHEHHHHHHGGGFGGHHHGGGFGGHH
jgi:hypothetical protein